MKLILEKDEVVRIIGKHFDAVLDPAKVVIRTDPIFEIEVSGIPLADTPPEPSNVVNLPRAAATQESFTSMVKPPRDDLWRKRDDENASQEDPTPGLDDVTPVESPEIHPAAILQKSQELAAQLDAENPQLALRRRGGSSKPPTDFRDEI